MVGLLPGSSSSQGMPSGRPGWETVRLEPIETFPFGGKKSKWQNEFSLLKSGGRCPKAQKAGDKIGVSGRASGGI